MTPPIDTNQPTDALIEGVQAPRFALATASGPISNESFSGKSVVLFFYPRDNTPGCTTEALEFTALIEEFAAANTTVVGISKDTLKKHENFANKHDLKVLLASDADSTTCEDFGVWREKKMYGKTFYGIERSTFLLDGAGRVQRIWRKVKPAGHAAEVLEAAKAITQ
ncbi:peroxiredoxin [Halocynthiibacter sp. C4]|uniref:peroxiredoxin n=1 Tax=Halocynthiibacter sp. C4 TaxID=2992758 RepID=UPI00237A954F|nr:peroxiredoxin [Halocynthiibacter sp. C4]MDE0589834.1 peroxiredoxin [Halocynthiibacter sp. C4]